MVTPLCLPILRLQQGTTEEYDWLSQRAERVEKSMRESIPELEAHRAHLIVNIAGSRDGAECLRLSRKYNRINILIRCFTYLSSERDG
jgi:hypothetical protein